MNALELADNFDTLGRFNDWAEQAQAMLRQQHAEIEALKANNQALVNIAMELTMKEKGENHFYIPKIVCVC